MAVSGAEPRTASRIMGVISDALRANLRELAQADARMLREIDQLTRQTGKAAPAIAPSLDAEIAAAIALLRANGYTVTK